MHRPRRGAAPQPRGPAGPMKQWQGLGRLAGDNLTAPLAAAVGCGLVFLVLVALGVHPAQFLMAFAVNGALAALAVWLKVLTEQGALTAAVMGAVVYLAFDWRGFLLLVMFLAVGSLVTRLGREVKMSLKSHGEPLWQRERTAGQAVANGLVGMVAALLFIISRAEPVWSVAYVAALATAAGDTVSSELGVLLGKNPRYFPTFRPAPRGADGAVSAPGSLAGLGAIALVCLVAVLLDPIRGPEGQRAQFTMAYALMAAGGAVAGNLVDSLLGCTVEGKFRVGNNVVNLLATLSGSAAACGLYAAFTGS